jgi:hypothetical protein
MQTLNLSRIIRALAITAIASALPGLLIAQETPTLQTTGGPFVTVAAMSGTELPAAPSTAIVHGALPAANAAMFPIVEASAPHLQSAEHPFWDRQNTALFAATAGWATADFCVTHSNLARGGQELNPVARMFTKNTPLLATNFALETGGVIGMSYFFHKTGHHKLERMTSYVDISGSAGAVLWGLTHR